jgi:hypothetical protein
MNIGSAPQTSTPRSSPSGNGFNMPSLSNTVGSAEKENAVQSSVQRGKVLKKTTNAIISTRSDFVSYLRQSGLDLLTSAIEFQESGDFIKSSYVIYTQHKNQMEPLTLFITRYPQLQESILKISESLKPYQESMKVRS